MKQYQLMEQEARDLAAKFASESVKSVDYFVGDAKRWISDYMDEYNKAMAVIEAYNQSSDG